MVKLGPINFLMGFPLIININDGQNKFEVHISKRWPIFGYFHFCPYWMDITSPFHPILTFNTAKMISSSRHIEWCWKLSFISFRLGLVFGLFSAPRPHMGSLARMDPKPPSSCEYMSNEFNKTWMYPQVQAQGMWGLTASYLAIDMEEGKEVVWNEIEVSATRLCHSS